MLASKSANSKGRRRGDVYFEEKNFERALELYLEEYKETDENELKADFVSQIAFVYEYLDKYSEALTFYKQALHILQHESKNDEPNAEIAKCLQNIAIVYRCMGEFRYFLNFFLRINTCIVFI